MTVADDIRASVSMADVLDLLGLEQPPRWPGHIPCVAHEENTASLWLTEDRGWFAFCCGQGGGVIELVRFVTGASFGQACLYLSGLVDDDLEPVERAPRQEKQAEDFTDRFLSETEPVLEGDPAFSYIRKRWPHLDIPRLNQCFSIRATPHALWIPHRAPDGSVCAVKTRSLYTGDKKAITGSTYPLLYCRPYEFTSDQAWLCEGESDTWTLTQASFGVHVFGLPSGASTIKPAYIDQLAQYRSVVLFLDNDPAGHKARTKVTDELIKRDVWVINGDLPEEFKDPTDAVMAGWTPDV